MITPLAGIKADTYARKNCQRIQRQVSEVYGAGYCHAIHDLENVLEKSKNQTLEEFKSAVQDFIKVSLEGY